MQPRMKESEDDHSGGVWPPVLLWVATTNVLNRLNVSSRRIAVAGLHGKAMQQGSVAVPEHLRISIWWQFTTLDRLFQSAIGSRPAFDGMNRFTPCEHLDIQLDSFVARFGALGVVHTVNDRISVGAIESGEHTFGFCIR